MDCERTNDAFQHGRRTQVAELLTRSLVLEQGITSLGSRFLRLRLQPLRLGVVGGDGSFGTGRRRSA